MTASTATPTAICTAKNGSSVAPATDSATIPASVTTCLISSAIVTRPFFNSTVSGSVIDAWALTRITPAPARSVPRTRRSS